MIIECDDTFILADEFSIASAVKHTTLVGLDFFSNVFTTFGSA
jgi:hypothetical protein